MAALTVAQGAKQMAQIGRVLSEAEGKAVRRAALEAKRIQLAQLKDAAPNLVMRVGKNRRTRVGVGFTMTTRDGRPAAVMAARGPVHLIERDTSPHWIPRQLGGTITHTATGRRRSKASIVRRKANVNKVLKIGNNLVKGPIKHPGTKGKHPWGKGADDVERTVHVDVFAEVSWDVMKVIG